MTIKERIEAFVKLGDHIRQINEVQLNELQSKARAANNWFTTDAVATALKGIEINLHRDKLDQWLAKYSIRDQYKTVAVVMAGNVPAVGFHDLLCILLSGNVLMAKLSSKDTPIIEFLIHSLLELAPALQDRIILKDRLKDMDAVIATGSDNTARYFHYYFGKYPNIIRKNRTSVGILKGNETPDDLQQLGHDIFLYYGLGCRNVSKLFVPANYNPTSFLESIAPFKTVLDHHKYQNNYDYNKSIYLVNKEEHLDNGFLLLKEEKNLVSPISVLYYQRYQDDEQLATMLEKDKEKIQCVVSKEGQWPGSFSLGQAQFPGLSDYADEIDTMEFLTRL